MTSPAIQPPSFEKRFLAPTFWPTWLGIALLYIFSWLPIRVLRVFAKGIAWLLRKLVKKRVNVARRNLALTFPDMPHSEREVLLQRHLECAGMAVFELAIGWWAPAWRIRRLGEVEGFEHVERIIAQGKGVFALALHNMNLELACRILGYHHPSIAFYRKHNNPLIDYMQYHGRNRSNKYMIHKRNARALINALDQGELCLYLPDQDYGRAQSVFVPFGGVAETATTGATLMFARRANCIPLIVTSQYTRSGYKVKFYPPLLTFADKEDTQALTDLNKDIESIVKEQPESYLWMHKRFKTRPQESDPSLYD
ncbi:LpxL/LpxP family Kdo(2)-lipid IV(A) lauroyl/palmitoleoyl acyltransferase [Alteromonas oceanisediminis]|uniref:LpxL/LpxP family Kdo(2)-lipid IV(A) lauroyl/palmitoleoyl acyltransferase n=1 Tax=Alteromonas oceanisediminis TaxID=2836180 RepID=UPI001BD9C937|nr:LpxL/LpxP family Kdo(2)-lipid IV(A) lauroyl/palmitoleoyl acyltransferase [Alteromonas oceanisediminis]MBT0585650.1 LpxL/LpxP family Kdo(2)-lipid IV(A) lauroyl/palmitoleoyl acyltransferase [Alteromonas oceanisediminis]